MTNTTWKLNKEDYEAYGLLDVEKMSRDEMVQRIRNPAQRVMTTMGALYNMEAETKAKERKRCSTRLRILRGQGYDLHDREVILACINAIDDLK